jgi:hypothetical protein
MEVDKHMIPRILVAFHRATYFGASGVDSHRELGCGGVINEVEPEGHNGMVGLWVCGRRGASGLNLNLLNLDFFLSLTNFNGKRCIKAIAGQCDDRLKFHSWEDLFLIASTPLAK